MTQRFTFDSLCQCCQTENVGSNLRASERETSLNQFNGATFCGSYKISFCQIDLSSSLSTKMAAQMPQTHRPLLLAHGLMLLQLVPSGNFRLCRLKRIRILLLTSINTRHPSLVRTRLGIVEGFLPSTSRVKEKIFGPRISSLRV